MFLSQECLLLLYLFQIRIFFFLESVYTYPNNHINILTLKAPFTTAEDDILKSTLYFLEKMGLEILCESFAGSHEIYCLIFTQKKITLKLRMSSATSLLVFFLRINTELNNQNRILQVRVIGNPISGNPKKKAKRKTNKKKIIMNLFRNY